jgi:protein-S-isoprenylcysteine O-methyltransferase Ste14
MDHVGDPEARHSLTDQLKRIPLALRVTVYGAGLLALVLGALPHLFHQLDIRFPTVHVEIGPLRSVGVILAMVGLVLYLRAAGILVSRGKGGHVEFEPPTQLVVTGPYRYTRNPVAACLLVTMLGEGIAFSSTGIFIMCCVASTLAHVQVTRIEEPLLRKRYG